MRLNTENIIPGCVSSFSAAVLFGKKGDETRYRFTSYVMMYATTKTGIDLIPSIQALVTYLESRSDSDFAIFAAV